MALTFNFHPPFSHAKIESVRQQILEQIPHYEILKRNYFESCLESLVHYAIAIKHESKNFTFDIAYFNPHFDPERKKESKTDWDHDKVWIKIRVSGGIGNIFKDRYMASQFGVRRIDWKRKAHHELKGSALPLTGKFVEIATEGTHLAPLGKVIKNVCGAVGEAVADKLKEQERERARGRFHQHSESKGHLFHQLQTITAAELYRIQGELPELSHMALRHLLTQEEPELTWQRFSGFWCSMLGGTYSDAGDSWCRVTGNRATATSEEFVDLFTEVMRARTNKYQI